jgi:AraC family transcriptional regulator
MFHNASTPMSDAVTVFDQLSHSRAQLLSRLDLGRGRGVAIWSNDLDRVRYHDTKLHTVSLYLEGGEEIRRMDRGAIRGRPGALCLIPQGNSSEWDIGEDFRFVHLYLADERLRHFLATTLDREPSTVDLPDRTYFDEAVLGGHMLDLAIACDAGDALAAEEATARVCHRLLTLPAHGGRPARPVAGGLAPAISRRVIARMRDSLEDPPSLEELAGVADLSPFHFQRMFRVSHGLTPAAYLEDLRVEEAKRRMRRGDGLADIAAACGWCHQSAFTRAFRAATGLTPGAWRAAATGVRSSAA